MTTPFGTRKSQSPATDRVVKRSGGSLSEVSSKTNANLSKVQMNTREGIEDIMKGPHGAIGHRGRRTSAYERDLDS